MKYDRYCRHLLFKVENLNNSRSLFAKGKEKPGTRISFAFVFNDLLAARIQEKNSGKKISISLINSISTTAMPFCLALGVILSLGTAAISAPLQKDVSWFVCKRV